MASMMYFANSAGTANGSAPGRRTTEALMPLGVIGREELSHELEDRLAEAEQSGRPLALMWLSVLQSAPIPGHRPAQPSRSLLRHCAERIAARLREGDILGYMGEGDFAILVGSIHHPADAIGFARSLVEAFQRPFLEGTSPLYAEVDIGVAVHPNDGELPVRLLRSAQQAARQAASEMPRRRARLFFSSETLNSRQQRYEQITDGLQSALEREEFMLHYQPMLYLPGDEVAGVEALIRWQNDTIGKVPPDEFIPTAERSGAIVDIGKWVLAEACRQARAWQQGGMPVRVAVNLSARQLQEPDLTDYVSGVLEDTALDPALLELELTESVYAEPETAISVLKRLHDLGVRVAIDDFGTGYSSLSYLASFPRDTLKIDRSFISLTTESDEVAAVVGSVIVMAHALGVETVAEGVETVEHLDFLRHHKCDLSQGFLHSPPLPPSELEPWLRAHRQAHGTAPLGAITKLPERSDECEPPAEPSRGADRPIPSATHAPEPPSGHGNANGSDAGRDNAGGYNNGNGLAGPFSNANGHHPVVGPAPTRPARPASAHAPASDRDGADRSGALGALDAKQSA
jgi:EAL domain-containing protein (putative c-di-GMP-specific phosphodiesterase class I)/GGDEF domain-containing protein